MPIKQILSDTKIMIGTNFLAMIFYTFIFLVVSISCGFLIGLAVGIPALAVVLSIIYTILIVPFSAAYLVSFLKLYRGEESNPKSIFSDTLKYFGKFWKTTLFFILIMLIPLVIAIGGLFLIRYVAAQQAAGVPPESLGVPALCAIALFLVGLILIMYLLVKYTLVFFIQYDHKDMKIKNIFKNSKKLMVGTKLNLFLIIFVAQLLLSLLDQVIGRFAPSVVIYNVVTLIISLIITPFLAALTVTIYEEKKTEIEE